MRDSYPGLPASNRRTRAWVFLSRTMDKQTGLWRAHGIGFTSKTRSFSHATEYWCNAVCLGCPQGQGAAVAESGDVWYWGSPRQKFVIASKVFIFIRRKEIDSVLAAVRPLEGNLSQKQIFTGVQETERNCVPMVGTNGKRRSRAANPHGSTAME